MNDELSAVVLTTDLPKNGRCAGDLGTVVIVHQEGKVHAVEFTTPGGDTIAVAMLSVN